MTSFLTIRTCLCQKHLNAALKLKKVVPASNDVSVNPDVFIRKYETDEKLHELMDSISTDEV